MIVLVFIIASLYLLVLGLLAWLVWRAPEGFEDDKGFHVGQRALGDDPSL